MSDETEFIHELMASDDMMCPVPPVDYTELDDDPWAMFRDEPEEGGGGGG